jgi:hypothetical protein
MRRLSLILFVIFPAISLFAQTPGIDYERLLVPIVVNQPIPGAAGSLWTSTLVLRSSASTVVDVYPVNGDCGGISLCPPGKMIGSMRTVRLEILHDPTREGALLFIDKRFSTLS